MTTYSDEEVKAAIAVVGVENGRRRDTVKPDHKQPTYVKIYLHQSEALVWAAEQYMKSQMPRVVPTRPPTCYKNWL